MNTVALVDEVSALPVEDRALVVQSLLLGLDQLETNMDSKWVNVAINRLGGLRNGNK